MKSKVLGRACDHDLLVPQGGVGGCDLAFSRSGDLGRIECSRFDFLGEFYELGIPLRNLCREIAELLLYHDALPDLLAQLREAELHFLDFCCLPLTGLACLLIISRAVRWTR